MSDPLVDEARRIRSGAHRSLFGSEPHTSGECWACALVSLVERAVRERNDALARAEKAKARVKELENGLVQLAKDIATPAEL